MRRFSARAVRGALPAAGRRGVYSIWGTVVHEGNSLQKTAHDGILSRLTETTALKCFQLEHTPVATGDHYVTMTPPERHLYSAIEDDIKRLGSVDWTTDFDPFWADVVAAHRTQFDRLYGQQSTWLSRVVFGDCAANTAAKTQAQARLLYLESMLKWALEAEKVYSAIFYARFEMQREVFDAFEREKILGGCVDALEKFEQRVPAEFKRKATQDLLWHLNNMRHWVWDCPNAKQEYTRKLA